MNGPEFKKARRLVKIYQKQLAKDTGVGLRAIEMYEQSKSQIASDKFEIILNAIGYCIKPCNPVRKKKEKYNPDDYIIKGVFLVEGCGYNYCILSKNKKEVSRHTMTYTGALIWFKQSRAEWIKQEK